MARIITLTSDFGLSDSYVGAMKGVILSVAPTATIVDICHGIAPQDLLGGALALESVVDFFPRGAIHVAVVDPGVGTDRAAIAISTERAIFVGPDNGIFTLALRKLPLRQAVRLTNANYFRHPVSATFHGRDIFASVAAHIAAGVPFRVLGEPLDSVRELMIPQVVVHDGSLTATVLSVDRFGNLITNLTREDLESVSNAAELLIYAGETTIRGIDATYGEASEGSPLAYFGSGGRLEIAVRNGRAVDVMALSRGDSVVIR